MNQYSVIVPRDFRNTCIVRRVDHGEYYLDICGRVAQWMELAPSFGPALILEKLKLTCKHLKVGEIAHVKMRDKSIVKCARLDYRQIKVIDPFHAFYGAIFNLTDCANWPITD